MYLSKSIHNPVHAIRDSSLPNCSNESNRDLCASFSFPSSTNFLAFAIASALVGGPLFFTDGGLIDLGLTGLGLTGVLHPAMPLSFKSSVSLLEPLAIVST